ncbi:MAG: Hsp70 family protein [Deltaproteobacteria bacterium]|nr:Hsp70 family protein [Deltaproteobacteria bacterium]
MAAHRPFAGLDFGTTNTALGLVHDTGDIALAPLPNPGRPDGSTWRTVLFFEPDAPPSAGNVAIDRFMQAGGEGRLIQSIKSHLASAAFKKTVILGRAYSLETLIATYLRHFIAAVKLAPETKVVVGRPVRYWGAQDDNDEALALERMRDALASAGFGEAVFEYEPVAAALRYAAKLDHEELIMVADFGGGTSDFSLVRVGPKVEPGERKAILATSGLGVGGDSFDARVIDAAVAPQLGLHTTYKDEFGAETPVPAALFGKLRRWHYLSFLKDARTLQLLERIEHGTHDKQKIGRMLSLVRDELGLPLHRAVEQAKVQLSAAASGALQFPDVDLDVPLLRQDFEQWIVEELGAIDTTIDDMLAKAGISAADVDTVFATGGSSLVPVVRQRLAARFGAQKLLGGEELTSVAWGLAARARDVFA